MLSVCSSGIFCLRKKKMKEATTVWFSVAFMTDFGQGGHGAKRYT